MRHNFKLAFHLLFILVIAFSCQKQKTKWMGKIEEDDNDMFYGIMDIQEGIFLS